MQIRRLIVEQPPPPLLVQFWVVFGSAPVITSWEALLIQSPQVVQMVSRVPSG